VKSSNIAPVGYDLMSSTLEIEFKGGAVYRYADVPYHKYESLMLADSKGTYFKQCIREYFTTTKVG
jgi:hypothetical protein